MRTPETCVGCGKRAPETETNYTLISGRHGWRLSRTATPEGVLMEWRCPTCWKEHKQSIASGAASPTKRRSP